MSEEENVFKINLALPEVFKYAGVPEDTRPESFTPHTDFWQKVVAGFQQDETAWEALSGKFMLPAAGEGFGYILHAWFPMDPDIEPQLVEKYNLTVQLVATPAADKGL